MQDASTELDIAPLLLRASAVLIDLAILVVINFAMISVVDRGALESGNMSQGAYAVGVIISAVYYIGFLAAISATPGKLAMGLYVADTRGHRVRPDTAILRYLVFLAGNAVFAIGLFVSIAMVLTDRQRRTLHDRVARTLVLRRPKDRELPPPDFS